MSSPNPIAHIDPHLSCTKSVAHRQICEFNVFVSESDVIVTPDGFQLPGSLFFDEFWISSVSLSFADLRSMTRVNDLCKQQVLKSSQPQRPHMRPDTVGFLVGMIVDCGMKLVSLHGEDDVSFGYVIRDRLHVEYFQKAAFKEDLAICRQFDDMEEEEEEEDGIEDYDRDENEDDDIEGVDNNNDEDGIEDYDMSENEDDMEDEDDVEIDDEDIYDEANPRFRGVEEGRYDGGEGKQVLTCCVCFEDLSSGVEFNKLPCSHTFHSSCIHLWLRRNRSCPNCRTPLTKLEEPIEDNVVLI